MRRLLVVDPLQLMEPQSDGSFVCRSSRWFERALAGVEGAKVKIVSADESRICEWARESAGVILGGSDRSAWQDTPSNDLLLDLIAICKHREIPFLGICYGSQLLGRALGGKVGPHPDGVELGEIAVSKTPEGTGHPLFEGVSGKSMRVVQTHFDAVLELPASCAVLASSEHTRIQAFACDDLFFGVQFHPEMEGSDLAFLWDGFARSGLIDSVPEEYRSRIGSCRCPASPALLRNFARLALARATELRI